MYGNWEADRHFYTIHAIKTVGFEYCGIILCWNGDERLTFQHN